jgi:hypothetical protein
MENRSSSHPVTLEGFGYDGLYKISITIRIRVEPTPHKCNIFLAAKLQMLAQRLEFELNLLNFRWRKLVNEAVREAAATYIGERATLHRDHERDRKLVVNLPQQLGLQNAEIKV